MPRRVPERRFRDLVERATGIFIERGYRRTQMADVARELGVAKGTLYGYVESKEALFDAALRFADRLDEVPGPEALPLLTPEPGATVGYVRGRLEASVSELSLAQIALGGRSVEPAERELAEIVGDLYRRMVDNRHVIKLVDRCASDLPELHALWFGDGRWAQHALLSQVIERRIARGDYHPVVSLEIAARLLLETIAFWAVHRHFDPSPQAVDDAQVERALVEHCLRSMIRGAS